MAEPTFSSGAQQPDAPAPETDPLAMMPPSPPTPVIAHTEAAPSAPLDPMSVLRRVAAGLSHDLANVLMPIRLGIESLNRTELAPRARSDVTAMADAAQRIQSLCNGLRALSRDPTKTGGDQRTDVGPWWCEMELLVRALVPGTLGSVLPAPQKELTIGVARHRLTGAVFELFFALAGAAESRRKIDLSLDELQSPPSVRITLHDIRPAPPLDIKRQCLVPFLNLAAQPADRQSAGLQMVHDVVAAAGGSLDIDSRPTGGTAFMLTFPLLSPSSGEAPSPTGSRKTAVVRLPETGQTAYVRNLLASLGIDHTGGSPPDVAMLWITADPDEALSAAGQNGPARAERVLYLGDELPQAPSNVVILGARPHPAAVRSQLRHAARFNPAPTGSQ